MYTYAELKAMFEEGKKDAKKAIVALLIQSNEMLSAREIAERIGVPVMTVSNWLSQNSGSEIKYYLYSIDNRFHLYSENKTVETTYVNPLNPSDTFIKKDTHRVYWVK